MSRNEYQYLDLIRDVWKNGEVRPNRTGVDTKALFGVSVDFNLHEGFPLMTTKKVHFHSVKHELLWMLSGSSRTDYLRDHKVSIWDEWASSSYRPELGYEEGDLGPVYGVQWRKWSAFRAPKAGGIEREYIDQIAWIVNELRNNPSNRRIILSSWNVGDIPVMKLPPCHYAAQFLVDGNNGLTCVMSIRSWDLFLGGPFNIAQYALLTHMLAHVSNLSAKRLRINAGDAHLYVNHERQVHEQCARHPYEQPTVWLDPDVKNIDEFTGDHIDVVDYNFHPAIKAEVAV